MVNRKNTRDLCVLLLLVTVGVVVRVAMQHIPNFAPVAALALFAGFFFTSRWLAAIVPLSVMAISDRLVVAGGYDTLLMLTVYGLLVLPIGLSGVARQYLSIRQRSWPRVLLAVVGLVGCSLGCSLMFFFGTNFMVWLTSSLYAPTWQGLVQCYANAIPFFRFTLAGDLAFALAFFGGHAMCAVLFARTPARADLVATDRL